MVDSKGQGQSEEQEAEQVRTQGRSSRRSAVLSTAAAAFGSKRRLGAKHASLRLPAAVAGGFCPRRTQILTC
jgi:hypothetical protein